MTVAVLPESPLLAIPLDLTRGDPTRFTVLLDHFCTHPGWMSRPMSPEEQRVTAAYLLTHPEHRIWEVWNGGQLVGIFQLTRLNPGVDALFHFMFLDHNLLGRRRFMQQFLWRIFGDLGLQRVSWECPEHVKTLIQFMRGKLGFKYEGEERTMNHPALRPGVASGKLQRPEVWVARQGSRREGAYWYQEAWHDLVCLRLLKTECEVLMKEG